MTKYPVGDKSAPIPVYSRPSAGCFPAFYSLPLCSQPPLQRPHHTSYSTGKMTECLAFPKEKLNYSQQSVEVPGTRKEGQTAIWPELITLDSPQPFVKPRPLRTLVDIFDSGLYKSRTEPFTGVRPVLPDGTLAKHFAWSTYAEIDVRRRRVGSALEALRRKGELWQNEPKLQTVGIWSGNRPEWQVIDLALHAYGKVGVSLYDTLGPDSVEYIINHAELSIVFTTASHLTQLVAITAKCPVLKVIVSIDKISEQTRNTFSTWAAERGVRITTLEDIEELGAQNLIAPFSPDPKSVVSICYTSGTTNVPKGVVLTHEQLTLSTVSCLHGGIFTPGGALLSYLPLAHIYERIAELLSIAVGGRIGYFSGNPLLLLEDAQILKPTYFPSVPRVLNRIFQAAIVNAKAPGVKGMLFRKALETKLHNLRTTGNNVHPLWDRIIFSKVQAVLGGNITMMTCGSAPIGRDAMEFLRIAFACEVVEGYGMTENCGTCTRVFPDDPASTTTVGPPQPVNEIKLVDVPEMGYRSTDKPSPRGEIYEANTKKTIDAEGWLHTGDVGMIDTCGRFKIIDRVKNIMKLAQGEYVALEKVENAYSTCPVVAQIYVHGDSMQDHLIAVVVPDPAQLETIVSKAGLKGKPLEEVINHKSVVSAIQQALNREGKKQGLNGFEMIKNVHVTLEAFTTDNNLLTPTFKVRRRDAYARYKAELDRLYELGPPAKL
ncbi:long-chain-fatty-acid-CoA ligase [Rhizoctonia solani AG-1 IA]|uniref:Long-chain-fatty-acid-CoA ligase n=1 Tax=Thanatephorus cucumeris (strain AG1-IA) TaxID=983506 RepID=L8WKX0_THACA|nr:long-chain-fatty-acid-CoA ligase [Rhizoctonia solani AG-1 IA]